MKKILAFGLVAVAAVLAGCASKYPQTSNESYERTKAYPVDDFTGESKVEGADFSYWINGIGTATCYLYSSIDKKLIPTTSFICSVLASEWLFLTKAFDSNQKERNLVVIDQKIHPHSAGGGINEVVGIVLEEQEFIEAIKNGEKFKFIGKRGSFAVELPPYYFEGYANKLTAHLRYRIGLNSK